MKKRILITLAVSTLFFTACKKDKDSKPAESELSFHLHTLVGNTAANYTDIFTDNTGRKFNIADCRYYISNIVLIKDDGTEFPLTDKALLASPSQKEYSLGNVPVGKYKGFRFLMGLDSVTNHDDPAGYAASNPLSYQNPTIHWGWNNGYIFMEFVGKFDSTVAATGNPVADYFYHIGFDDLKRTIDFSNSPFEITTDAGLEIGILFDLKKVLNNVDLRTEFGTHTMDNMPLAVKIANNWQGAYSIE
ncbi:MAG TPA: hypothetical protein PLU85_07990 [Bacteroidia bacterium]|nr:hypothetical protein [Bacteroidia bacterium]MBP7713303.1 hypothetical protein [Bacteroidia bacterium]MBP8669057.1 hypothetical protein [Bacteroidia bacterium]HOZ82045.1 hypothetical protein [Bacteroidia bacterium]HOZ89429.1 hypothetical protein [Bacteroidia bacterium]